MIRYRLIYKILDGYYFTNNHYLFLCLKIESKVISAKGLYYSYENKYSFSLIIHLKVAWQFLKEYLMSFKKIWKKKL